MTVSWYKTMEYKHEKQSRYGSSTICPNFHIFDGVLVTKVGVNVLYMQNQSVCLVCAELVTTWSEDKRIALRVIGLNNVEIYCCS